MLYLFEYDTLFLLNEAKKTPQKVTYSFNYPLYNENSKTVFLLHYKTMNKNWMPPIHQEQFEKIITGGFKYTLDNIVAYNVEEIVKNPEKELNTTPDIIFYMDDKVSDTVEKWLQKQKSDIRYLPPIAQMIENENFKKKAWKEIQDYLKTTKRNP
jgi:hypothetical protein